MERPAKRERGVGFGLVCCSCVANSNGQVLSLHYLPLANIRWRQAVAALWDNNETEVEAVHLAIALAYHGLLRVPLRAETSDVTPCTYSGIPLLMIG